MKRLVISSLIVVVIYCAAYGLIRWRKLVVMRDTILRRKVFWFVKQAPDGTLAMIGRGI